MSAADSLVDLELQREQSEESSSSTSSTKDSTNDDETEESKDSRSSNRQSTQPLTVSNTVGILVTSFVALLVAFVSLFSSKVSQLRQTKVQDDNKTLISDTKSLLMSHKAKIEKERMAIHHLDETLRSLGQKIRKYGPDSITSKKLKSEAQALLMTKRMKESILNSSVTDVYSLEQTLSQVEQISMSMERHNQMRPLLKNLNKLIPSQTALENLAKQKRDFMESTRKMNERMSDINFQIIESGEEYHDEQVDNNTQSSYPLTKDLDDFLQALDEEEASQVAIDMPNVPTYTPHVESPSQIKPPSPFGLLSQHSTPHEKDQSKPLISEFESME